MDIEQEERADHILKALPEIDRVHLRYRRETIDFDSMRFNAPDQFRIFGRSESNDWHIRIAPPGVVGSPLTWKFHMIEDDQEIIPGVWLFQKRLRAVTEMDKIVAMTDYHIEPQWFEIDLGRIRRVFERYNSTRFEPEQTA